MIRKISFCLVCCLVSLTAISQDGLNQVVVVNSGQFGNPAERSTLAYLNPVTMQYSLIDTLPANSIQDVLVDNDFAYVAAQNTILKYDLDSYELTNSVPFPGISAHQLEIHGDYLYATNYFAQNTDNLYVFNKNTLELLDTVQEITYAGGTMAIIGNDLYIGQNLKGSIDACPPFGCLNDTLGYLARIDLTTNQWVENISLDNNGNECGRITRFNNTIVTLNEASNTVTVFLPSTGASITESNTANLSTVKYRTEVDVSPGAVVSMFDGGVGVLSEDLMSADVLIDTPAVAFAYDIVNDHFYVIGTDFFSFNNGYVFNSAGEHIYDFPVGVNPEAIAVHYNDQPEGTDFSIESRDTIIIDVNDFATDPNGDNIVASRVENAPINGVLTILEDGSVRYVSFSPGSADAFRMEVCDDKLNPLCSFIGVTVSAISSVSSILFNDVSVYPNPMTSELNIVNAIPGSTYSLFNSVGGIVATFHEPFFETANLNDGIYFLKMSKGSDHFTMPLIKQ